VRKRRGGIVVLVAVLAAAVLAGTVEALVPSDPQADHPTYAALNLPAAWDLTTGSPRVVIAIVDSGIDAAQPDLAGAIRPGYDFVSRDADATDPPGGHGTAVAGVAAARASNGFGGMGTCFSCDLMPLRVLGLDGIAFNTNTAAAIDYAVDHGAAVVNASIYGPHSPPTLRDAIVRARAAGVLVVAAAGNEGTADPQYPAAFPEAISVGAATMDGVLARYSSFGSWLKFAAPECAPITSIGGGSDVGCATSVASRSWPGSWRCSARTHPMQAPTSSKPRLPAPPVRFRGPAMGS
jgi:subtilisin family serine protease